eukprot:212969-Chlamydomonas_euryale.AAC.2
MEQLMPRAAALTDARLGSPQGSQHAGGSVSRGRNGSLPGTPGGGSRDGGGSLSRGRSGSHHGAGSRERNPDGSGGGSLSRGRSGSHVGEPAVGRGGVAAAGPADAGNAAAPATYEAPSAAAAWLTAYEAVARDPYEATPRAAPPLFPRRAPPWGNDGTAPSETRGEGRHAGRGGGSGT